MEKGWGGCGLELCFSLFCCECTILHSLFTFALGVKVGHWYFLDIFVTVSRHLVHYMHNVI